MKQVQRNEVLGLADYEPIRDRFRARVIEEKKARRVTVGDKVSAVFENHDTVLLQIQEMLRTERISREAAIQHEIDTYNAHVPGTDELFATVMIEIGDKEEREAFLVKARGFERHVAIIVEGEKSPARWEETRELEDRASAVNYLRFSLSRKAAAYLRDAKKNAKVEMVIDHAAYAARAVLSPATVASLAEDLAE